jgi:hypothetical protein
MRILLQNFETGLYLDTSGAWTSTPELARSFPSTRQAAEFKIQRRLDQALVIVLPEPAPPLARLSLLRQERSKFQGLMA